MKIPCESCHSVFRLNSSLIKDTGSVVRCSKCRKVFRVYPPPPPDPRKSPRIETRNLISYFSFNKAGKLISEGLGVALDISQGGILLETPCNIKSGLLVLATIDRKNNLIEVKGELIRSRKTSSGMFHCGIKFIGVDERMEHFISNLIQEYNFRRKNLHIAIKQKVDKMNLQSISACSESNQGANQSNV